MHDENQTDVPFCLEDPALKLKRYHDPRFDGDALSTDPQKVALTDTPPLQKGLTMAIDARDTASRSDKGDEVFGPQETNPRNRILTDTSRDDDDYCVSIAAMPPGVVVPLHSHADHETFYILSGEMQGYDGNAGVWRTLRAGDVFDVTDGLRHAWRNAGHVEASMLFVTTNRMARFLREASELKVGGTPEDAARGFGDLVARFGYWCAGPEENAAIGLTIGWGAAAER
jgi:quercetin dioxygenase-like cupin family protein